MFTIDVSLFIQSYLVLLLISNCVSCEYIHEKLILILTPADSSQLSETEMTRPIQAYFLARIPRIPVGKNYKFPKCCPPSGFPNAYNLATFQKAGFLEFPPRKLRIPNARSIDCNLHCIRNSQHLEFLSGIPPNKQALYSQLSNSFRFGRNVRICLFRRQNRTEHPA